MIFLSGPAWAMAFSITLMETLLLSVQPAALVTVTAVSYTHLDVYKRQAWDGLKGYITNTKIPDKQVIENYKNLWHIEKAFRMSKTDLRIRPIYHRLRHRIEAHICICLLYTSRCV